jgi:hypothetical protein
MSLEATLSLNDHRRRESSLSRRKDRTDARDLVCLDSFAATLRLERLQLDLLEVLLAQAFYKRWTAR